MHGRINARIGHKHTEISMKLGLSAPSFIQTSLQLFIESDCLGLEINSMQKLDLYGCNGLVLIDMVDHLLCPALYLAY